LAAAAIILAPLAILFAACTTASTTLASSNSASSCNAAANARGCLVACHDGRLAICLVEEATGPSCACK
jgi:hypothetical protein